MKFETARILFLGDVFAAVAVVVRSIMNDFPVIGDPCFAHRILGSPGGKHCESLQRNVWRGVVSPLKAVSLDRMPHFAVIL